jgi:predicted transcriptional regulator
MLAEHLAACKAAQDKIASIEDNLSSKKLSPEQVAQLKSSLEDAKEQLRQLESQQTEVKAKMCEAGLTCKNSVNGEVVDIAEEAQTLLAKVDKDDVKLKFCERVIELERRMQETDGNLDRLKQVYTDDLETMGTAVQVINYFTTC